MYDRSETDELGIRITAEDMGVELGYLPFYKVSVGFDNGGHSFRSLGRDLTGALGETRVVLNRTQSKGRRIYGATIMEALGKYVLNPLHVESTCQSKIRTLLILMKNGIRIPRTVYIPANVREAYGDGRTLDNTEAVARLIEQQLGDERVVVKPDAGTHGRGVGLSADHGELVELIGEIEPSVTNPSGVVAQEFIPKWFYDLRILVEKERGKAAHCPPTALVRGGFTEFRTNTFLGNMVFRVELPEVVRRESEKCAVALTGGKEAYVIALDAMPYIGDTKFADEDELRSHFMGLNEAFRKVRSVKADPEKKTKFRAYSEKIEEAYGDYMATDAYAHIQAVVQESLDKTRDKVLFHEGNSCPEFWEQTRIVGGINVAESILRSAVSMLDA
jgi:glutathione synthase/RimK-type ligase-like ATP-grasp enzyme